MGLYLKQMEIGPMQNFMYLVGDDQTKTCWIVDPAWNVEDVIKQAEADGYRIEGALVTHSHYDHCNGLEKLLTHRDMPVYLHKREIDINEKADKTGLFGALPKSNLKLVGPGDALETGQTKLTFLHTPGHTPGSLCFLVDNRLIAGDTLFIGSCGRCDLPGGNPYELFDSLNNTIGKLPENTILCPGHNYSRSGVTSTLSKEKTSNRMMSVHKLEDFLSLLGF